MLDAEFRIRSLHRLPWLRLLTNSLVFVPFKVVKSHLFLEGPNHLAGVPWVYAVIARGGGEENLMEGLGLRVEGVGFTGLLSRRGRRQQRQ